MKLRALSVVAFAHGASDFFSGMVPFTVFYIVTRDHLSAAYQGAMLFLWYLASSIVQPLFGAFTDRHGRWWFLPTGVALTALGVSSIGMMSSLWWLAGCILLGGFGSAIIHPEAGKYSALLSGERRASGLSIFQVGGQIGYALGPLPAAAFLARGGGHALSWFMLPGALAVAFLVTTMRRVDRLAAPADSHARAAARGGRIDHLGVALLIGSTALRNLVSGSFMAYLPNLLTARGESIVAAGEIVTLFLLVSTIGLFAGGFLADRFGALTVSVGSLILAVPALLIFCLTGGVISITALLIGSVLLVVQNAPGVALVQAMLPRNLGMALGLMNGVAFGIGSALIASIGVAVAWYGPQTALADVSLVPILSAFLFAMGGRRRTPTVAMDTT